jgi:glycosyltransferase involved in cell wall biosynthesis
MDTEINAGLIKAGPEAYSALGGQRKPTRRLAGATTLQIIPALKEDPEVRAAFDIAGALLRAGARTLIASSGGPLITEFHALGAEWIPYPSAHINRWNLNRSVNTLKDIVEAERVDLAHALGGGAAALAASVREQIPLRVVTSLPDEESKYIRSDNRSLEALARGDRIIAHSAFAAAPIVKQYGIAWERVVVIPRSIDTARLDPAAVSVDQVAAVRSAWGVRPGDRVFIAPGPIDAASGHIMLVDAVRVLVNGGLHGALFVVPSDGVSEPKHIRAIMERAAAQGVDAYFRFSHPPVAPLTLFCAADVVVLPAIESTNDTCIAEAQALARPVIASEIGDLPERLVAPPQEVAGARTGWLFGPVDPVELARTIGTVLIVDDQTLQTIGMRARQFAESVFSPQCVAAATLAVYTSVLDNG